MTRAFKILFTSYVKNKFNNIDERLNNLEMALDIIIESPKYNSSNEVGFNGQMGRKKIFLDLIRVFDFKAIVETGTFVGNTTGYMADTSKLPVYSCELNHRFCMISKARLSDFKSIHLERSDSRDFLGKLCKGELSGLEVFFYLDAHWNDDLPLVEEISIISGNWSKFVIMIDDFMVPWDDGYKYDDYGKGKILSLKLIDNVVRMNDIIPFFPSVPSSEETGYKRGCVLLVNKYMSEKMLKLGSLTRAKGY